MSTPKQINVLLVDASKEFMAQIAPLLAVDNVKVSHYFSLQAGLSAIERGLVVDLLLLDLAEKNDCFSLARLAEMLREMWFPAIVLVDGSQSLLPVLPEDFPLYGYLPKWWCEITFLENIRRAIQLFNLQLQDKISCQENQRTLSRHQAILKAMPDIVFVLNDQGVVIEQYTQNESDRFFNSVPFINQPIGRVLPPALADATRVMLERTLHSDGVESVVYCADMESGRRYYEGRHVRQRDKEVIAVVRDITDSVEYLEQLNFLKVHDKNTGLYDRNYFDQQINTLQESSAFPITIISADIDGMKFINDTLGNMIGSEILRDFAEMVSSGLRKSDFAARVGGDNFALVLSNSDTEVGEKVLQRINARIRRYNLASERPMLSVSFGMSTAKSNAQRLATVLREAEDAMHASKLSKGTSPKSKIVDVLLTALAQRDYITEGHSQRVGKISGSIGKSLGLTALQQHNLSLLAQVHDLGKVGIPDSILLKPGPLTKDEWRIMQKHPEKGYRIAMASAELAGIADLILKHHERWDGGGYPLRLSGDSIPIECRILAVVDAFDAMTNNRPYSIARSKNQALIEIKDCAGSQFDPQVVEHFVTFMSGCSSILAG